KLPPREALHLSLLFGAGRLSLPVGSETVPAAPPIGSLRRMAEGDGQIAARTPLSSFLAPMVTLRMRANSPHNQPGCALSCICRELTRSWSMSLHLDLHPLRLGRGTRSGVAPSWF